MASRRRARLLRRLSTVVSLAAIGAALVFLAVPSSAFACSLSGTHCHALVDYIPNDYKTGGLAWLKTDRLGPQSTSNFTVNTLWICTNGTNCPEAWVETGWRIGFRSFSSGTALTWYWAEDRVAQRCLPEYREFYDGTPIFLGSEYSAKISYNGNWQWGVYRAGMHQWNSSACHDDVTFKMQAGSETTTASGRITGRASDLQKRAQDNVSWSYNWGNSTFLRTGPSNPYSISWLHLYQSASYSAN